MARSPLHSAAHRLQSRHEVIWSRAAAIATLDDPARRASEDPEALWDLAELAPGMTVVEVGAGTGFYAFPAGPRVGASGRVYAVDRSPELVALLSERAATRRPANVRALRSSVARIPLRSGVADRVLLANVLHGFPPGTVREAVRLLRPGARLLDVDWVKRSTAGGGPPVRHRLSPAAARRALEAYGLRLLSHRPFGPFHYALVFEKPVARPDIRSRPRRG